LTSPEANSSGIITDLAVIQNEMNEKTNKSLEFLKKRYSNINLEKYHKLSQESKNKIAELVYTGNLTSNYSYLKEYLQRHEIINTTVDDKVKNIVRDITSFITSNSYSLGLENPNDFIVSLVKSIYYNLEQEAIGFKLVDELLIFYVDSRFSQKQKIMGYMKALAKRKIIREEFLENILSCM